MASESQARRAARRIGMIAKKSRWRKDSHDNQGGFMLIDERRNIVRYGSRFELSADDVVEICTKKKLAEET